MIAPLESRVNTLTGELERPSPASPLGLSNAHIWTQPTITLACRGRLLLLRHPSDEPPMLPDADRGDITTFSRQSRKRMMQLFAAIDVRAAVDLSVFITLTYPAQYPTDAAVWHSQLAAFLKCLDRRYPESATIWRLEFQMRGAPHFHLLNVGEAFIPQEWVTESWARQAHAGDIYQGQYACKVEKPHSWLETCSYVSKYMAKPSDTSIRGKSGRFWGVRRKCNLPIDLETVPLSPLHAQRIKAAVLARMPDEVRTRMQRYRGGGCWSMLPYSDALDILAETAGDQPDGLASESPGD